MLIKILRNILILLIATFSANLIYGQCCSQSTPGPGATNTGIMENKNLRIISFYRYSFADEYYQVNKPVDFKFLEKSDYHYWGNILSYGLTKKITIEAEIGYYLQKREIINHTPSINLSANGFNNSTVSVKYPLLKNINKNYEWSIGAGLKFPFKTTPALKDNVTLPVDLQPSTLTYGAVFHSSFFKELKKETIYFYLVNRMEINNENNMFYKYGNVYSSSVFVAAPIYKSVTGVLHLRHEYKEMNYSYDKLLINTGGHIAFVSPQINIDIKNEWKISTSFEIPFWRKYNGIQLGNKYSLSLGVTKKFCL